MKRSQINNAVEFAMTVLEENSLRLPEFAYWTVDDWVRNKKNIENLSEINLGWDVTDFGSEDFAHTGAVLFTIRNGCLGNPDFGTPYAEKVIILDQNTEQALPLHFHKMKTEDIINRSNGCLMMQLFLSNEDGTVNTADSFLVRFDGIERQVAPGEIFEIKKGSSVTLTPWLFHRFWAKKNEGNLVVGEVSSINDDTKDNFFSENCDRFSKIVEDEQSRYILCNEYNKILDTPNSKE